LASRQHHQGGRRAAISRVDHAGNRRSCEKKTFIRGEKSGSLGDQGAREDAVCKNGATAQRRSAGYERFEKKTFREGGRIPYTEQKGEEKGEMADTPRVLRRGWKTYVDFLWVGEGGGGGMDGGGICLWGWCAKGEARSPVSPSGGSILEHAAVSHVLLRGGRRDRGWGREVFWPQGAKLLGSGRI